MKYDKRRTVPLSQVCTLNMGQSPSSDSYNENKDGLPFFQGNADFGNIYPKERVWCSQPTKIANKDDILLSVRAPIGALNIAKEECCIGRGLAALSPIPSQCRMMYLFYALKSKVKILEQQGTGSTFKAVGKDIISALHIPLYPLEEQEHIISMLSCTDIGIANIHKQLAKLDTLVKSRFIEMFGDPVTNPMGFPVYKFSHITTSRLGKMLDKKRQTGKHKFPYLANYNVQWFHFELDNLNEMDFDEADRQEFELKYGDLLICEGGEVGRCAIWKGEKQNCYFQKALHRVRCDTNYIIPEYLGYTFYWHSQYNGFMDVMSGASTIAHLPGDRLKQLQIIVPPIERQNQFAAFVQQVDKSKSVLQKLLEKQELLRAALMQEYFG